MTRDDPAAGDPMSGGVSVRGLTVVTTDGIAVLHGVDLELAPGSATALVGVSGAGKTTLALALLGRLRPGLRRTSGTVRVAGVEPLDVPPRVRRAFRRGTIAWLGQDPAASLSPALRVADLVGEAAPGDRAARRGHVREALGSVDLPVDDGFLRRYPHQLSGGQQRRVALARALVRRPRVLVLDEPVTGLDPATRARVVEEIGALHRATGATLLVIGHVDLPGLTGRTVVLDRGRVVDARATVTPEVVPLRVGPPPRPARLVVTDLRAGHGGRPVIDGVGFALAPGECLALTGPSGIGKTTLARAVLGLHVPDGGQVRLDGVPLAPAVRHRTPGQRRAIAYVPQDPVGSLNPARSVGAILAHAAGGRPDRVTPLLEAVALDPVLAGRKPGGLSGGQRQRVALARALAADPQVLVCDEVTSALDPNTGAAVLDLLDRLRRERDLAILLITHDRDTAGRVATEALQMTAGGLAPARPDREVADVHRA